MGGVSGVYGFRLRGTSRWYVGSATNIEARKSRHISFLRAQKHHSVKLQRAWNKYGEDAFEFRVFEYVEVPDLLSAEQRWMDGKSAVKHGFNIHPKARSAIGLKRRPDTREKMSSWQRGRTLSDETKAKISASKRGKTGAKWAPEQRAALSEKKRQQQADPEFRAKMSASCKKAWASQEMRRKQSERAKASINFEARSDAQKRAWQNDETRQRRINGIKKQAATPEGAARRSAAAYARWEKRR